MILRVSGTKSDLNLKYVKLHTYVLKYIQTQTLTIRTSAAKTRKFQLRILDKNLNLVFGFCIRVYSRSSQTRVLWFESNSLPRLDWDWSTRTQVLELELNSCTRAQVKLELLNILKGTNKKEVPTFLHRSSRTQLGWQFEAVVFEYSWSNRVLSFRVARSFKLEYANN